MWLWATGVAQYCNFPLIGMKHIYKQQIQQHILIIEADREMKTRI